MFGRNDPRRFRKVALPACARLLGFLLACQDVGQPRALPMSFRGWSRAFQV